MGKNLKKIMAITLSFTLAVGITGCSKGSGKSSMGRYVEERYEAPTNSYVNELSILEDGRIAMFGYSEETSKESAFISEDGGQTWTNESIELPKQEGKETYTNNIGYLSDGRIFMFLIGMFANTINIPIPCIGDIFSFNNRQDSKITNVLTRATDKGIAKVKFILLTI